MISRKESDIKLCQQCPECAAAVPFSKTQMHLGKPFKCGGCDRALRIDRNYWIPLLALVTFFRFKNDISGFLEGAILVLSLFAAIYALTAIFMQPKLVKS
ncbi:hypothetical protein [Aurantiacibacter marinus]|uniref:Uncharacterized protein n=1 Tax=Aurantiacibacter marinus TaxID=874156 RepID=A0A0H0XQQ2_9SPHN|nr:hypothetical protein [Aurantiacibacter marinus]KLI64918.1 hypothetical protein AAV99_05305 [Aurantiacibacter marinus]